MGPTGVELHFIHDSIHPAIPIPQTRPVHQPRRPLPDLHYVAMQRLRAVKDPMNSLTDTRKTDTDETDVARIANAAYLLLQDSCDVLEVMEVMEVRLGSDARN
jgi:hypothetical protein